MTGRTRITNGAFTPPLCREGNIFLIDPNDFCQLFQTGSRR